MMRGDVVWHKFKEPDKTRPVVILTRNEAISELNAVTVVPMTTTIRNLPSQVILTEQDGMREVCAANVDLIQTVAKNKFGSHITHLSDEKMTEIFEAIRFVFGFDNL